MTGQSEGPAAGQGGRRGHELLRRWGLFALLPFAVAMITAMVITAYAETRGPVTAGLPGPQGGPTLARMMSLSPLPGRAAPGFTLTDQHGRRASLAGFRGRTVLLGFFDSRCTQVCPVIAQELIAADRALGRRAGGVALVGVNVNPGAESVPAVARFSAVHGLSRLPNWYFLTGPTALLARVWSAYGIEVGLPPGASQTIHQDYLFFISPLGSERFVAAPFADQRRDGTGYLPAGAVSQWGQGIARYLRQAASG